MKHSQLRADLTVAEVMNHWACRSRLLKDLERGLEQAERT
jgi:hypothetical protein